MCPNPAASTCLSISLVLILQLQVWQMRSVLSTKQDAEHDSVRETQEYCITNMGSVAYLTSAMASSS